MKLALEALEELTCTERTSVDIERGEAAIKSLEEALAKQEHDPYDEVAIAYGFPKKERFNNWTDVANMKHHIELIEARCDFMREKLALLAKQEKQEQGEPVAWESVLGAVARGWCYEENANKTMDSELAVAIAKEVHALYTTPQQRKPLTDEQLKPHIQIAMKYYGYDETKYGLTTTSGFVWLARAIEAAHGIKG
jgi:hypothetical protein